MLACMYPGCEFEAKNKTGLAAHTRAMHPGETPLGNFVGNEEEERENNEEVEANILEIQNEQKTAPGDIGVEELPEKEVEEIGLGGDDEKEEPGEEEEEEAPDMDYTQDDVENLCEMMINLPGVIFGDHLVRSKEQIKPFAKQLYIYCQKKGINPMDYFFDELGLVLAGGVLVRGMWNDHKKYKEKEKKEKEGVEEEESN